MRGLLEKHCTDTERAAGCHHTAEDPPARHDIIRDSKVVQKNMRQRDGLETPEPLAGEVFAGYDAFLSDIKGRVQAARTRAAFAVNAELVWL